MKKVNKKLSDSDKKKIIVTHDGLCHSDETLSVALLTLLFEKRGIDYEIIRIRDENQIPEEGDIIIIDVFQSTLDHHHMESKIEDGRALASIGLTWRWAKEMIMSTFGLDHISYKSIDKNLISYVDITDNTGEMNPWNYMFNCLRGISTSSETWEKCLNYCRSILSCILSTEKEKTIKRKKFKELPTIKICDRFFKISDEFISGASPDYGYIFKNENNHYTVKLFNNNRFTVKNVKSGVISGIDFVHKDGWIAGIRTIEDLQKNSLKRSRVDLFFFV